MKTRRSKKSLGPPPPPKRRNNRRKSQRKSTLVPFNKTETIVLSDSDAEDDIQVVDMANSSQEDFDDFDDRETIRAESSPDRVTSRFPCWPQNSKIVINPLAQTGAVHPLIASFNVDKSRSESEEEANTNVIEIERELLDRQRDDEVPLIDIGDDSEVTSSQSQSQQNKANDEEDKDIEILAVVAVPKLNRQSRCSNTMKRKRSSIRLGEQRRQMDNVLIMQQAIKRAKNMVRRSSSNSSARMRYPGFQDNNWNMNRIAATSKQISKKKKKKKNKRQQQLHQPPQVIRNFNFNRTREMNREVIIMADNNNIPEQILVNVNNGQGHPRCAPAPLFIPLRTSTPMLRPVGPTQGGGFRFRQEKQARFGPNRGRAPSPIVPGSNIIDVGTSTLKAQGTLRPIIIDGSNVAVGHGLVSTNVTGSRFSSRGIEICIDFFLRRGHQEIIAFVPRHRLKRAECQDPALLEELERKGHVRFTPSREVGRQRISSYDDLFILEYAHETGGIIVSNDNFRDVYAEQEHLRDTITFRILQYTWITAAKLMFPPDPLGRKGPSLDEFLKF